MGIVCRRLWADPDGRARYRKAFSHLLDGMWNEKAILEELDRVEKLLEPHLHVSREEFSRALGRVRSWVQGRRADVAPEIADENLEWVDLPDVVEESLNEVSMTLKGTFSGVMGAEKPGGKATLSVTVGDGDPIEILEMEMQGMREDPFFIRPGYPMIRLFGKHPKSKKPWYLSLCIDPVCWKARKPDLIVDHYEVWAMLVEGNPMSKDARRRPFGVVGKLRLDKLELKKGGAIEGSFELTAPAFKVEE